MTQQQNYRKIIPGPALFPVSGGKIPQQRNPLHAKIEVWSLNRK